MPEDHTPNTSKREFPKIVAYRDYVKAHPPKREPAPRPTPKASLDTHYATPEGTVPAPAPAAPAASPPTGNTDELTGHHYDGIQEYDNPTPGWWYAVFAATVVFSVFYALIYDLGGMFGTIESRHARVEAIALQERFAGVSQIPMSEEKLLMIMNEPSWLAQGESIFIQTCALCHTASGAGSVGPNLTDEKFKNIRTLMDIPQLIEDGAGNGAMPAQKNLLNENEIALVAAYAASLRGQDLPTGEGVIDAYRTGDPIPPWPEYVEDGAGG